MNDKALYTLEYDKIILRLTELAATSLGKEEAGKLRPSSDSSEVKRRLAATDEAVRSSSLKGAPPFGGVTDVRPSLGRAKLGGVLGPSELMDVAGLIMGSRRIRKYIQAVADEAEVPILSDLVEPLIDAKAIEDDIRRCIDEQGDVMDSASPELASVRRDIRINEGRAREKLDSLIRSTSVQKMLQDVLITIRNDRYVIPVKAEYRSHFGGIVHDQSGSGATLFIEPEAALQVNNKLRELKLKEQKEIERILRRLSELVGTKAELLISDAEALGYIDFIFAKAALADSMFGTLPAINDEGQMRLKRARHPLIPSKQVVPIDIDMGEEYSAIIVTGPNTGGKTVSLKTVGLLSLMAMSGLFVPADDGSRMCVFDGVFADIGDEQSIEQNLSTFSSHMTNLIGMLGQVTSRSLVLLDELGAGTDPAEGSALAIAILEHLHRIGCRLLATTHYSELKAYAYNRDGIINASMEFDVATLRPTYRLLVGVPGRSNAFAIASRLGLPKEIIEHARGEVSEEELKVDAMIASLEQDRRRAESERQVAERLRKEVETLRQQIEDERFKFQEQKAKLLADAREEARQAVAKAKREAEEIISDLRRMALEEGASVKEHKLIEAKRRLDDSVPDPVQQPRKNQGGKPVKIEPGDEVKVHSLGGQKGHVVELAGDSEALVQLGILKMKVALADLEPTQKAAASAPKKQVPVTTVKRSREENTSGELDLRGSTLDEALIETDRFLDEAFLANIGSVYIIHGKGTGALRAGIQEFLRRHKHVKSYRLGNYGEGGAGVTVAELK
ncbi:endonuclease MutS2 [Cohnella thailandensis]|uniref:Endonuclease MutS2 n=1 Tax=Cohnella thailandensis TaxID=557557 RepID=A0A841SUI7_9BACL|nr:endonuclease MutS2 [Cohnella thailandensis]MBP1976490.1 DNA mismatch repair protein MutS2 [Cohnella thailandensis]